MATKKKATKKRGAKGKAIKRTIKKRPKALERRTPMVALAARAPRGADTEPVTGLETLRPALI